MRLHYQRVVMPRQHPSLSRCLLMIIFSNNFLKSPQALIRAEAFIPSQYSLREHLFEGGQNRYANNSNVTLLCMQASYLGYGDCRLYFNQDFELCSFYTHIRLALFASFIMQSYADHKHSEIKIIIDVKITVLLKSSKLPAL